MKQALFAAALLLSGPIVAQAQEATGIRAFSKYDFIPGAQIITFDDFMQDAVGDFPGGWDTNASGEIVTIAGRPGHWLQFSQGGIFLPSVPAVLPDNFTFEFDVLSSTPFANGTRLAVAIVELSNIKQPAAWQGANNRYTFAVHPTGISSSERRKEGVGEPEVTTPGAPFASTNGMAHVAIWRNKERVRVYMNDQKVWDVPKAMSATGQFNSIIFYIPYAGPDYLYYISNVRLAVGAPDTRNQLLTQGKWVTHGILFDVNSDRIRGESYGTLKDIAGVLTENPAVRVKIVGHTDSDGEDAANMDLSRRRAAAVKSALTTEFGIDAARMETDGRGESQPAAGNDTPAGKANNRRVEFLKI